MMIRLTFLTLVFLAIFTFHYPSKQNLYADEYAGEKILYSISPIGRSEYTDLGLVDLDGKKAKLITFRTQVLWFDDNEKIYVEPDTLLPLKIERDLTSWLGKEFIIEDYDQKNFTLTLTKFKGNKKVSKQIIKEEGPIQNAILLGFYPRLQPKLYIGWSFKIRIPAKFEVKLVSVDEVSVPSGKFKAYHFTSNPDKFELWINQNNPRIPVKIRGSGGIKYIMLMKQYSIITDPKIK